MAIEMKSEALSDLIDRDAEVERVATGFTFTEGPLWDQAGHFLLFSDMPGDVRRRWSEKEGVVELRQPNNKGNGMVYDAEGNLLVCEHVTSSLVRERRDGVRETLAFHHQGKYLNSPNDVITRSDGTIYFTDPGFGRVAHFGIPREQELSFQGVYMIPAGGGDPHVVEKMRMNGFYETRLDILLRGLGVDSLVIAGCYTNMSIEHTARRTSRSPSGTSASSRGASSRTGTAMPLVCGRSAGRCHTIEPGRVLGEKTGGFHEHDDDPRRPDPTD